MNNVSKEKMVYLKDKLRGWPDAMALISEDVADLIGLIESSGEKEVQCPACEGSGREPVGEHFVTAEMASDAGQPERSGESMGIEYGPCSECGGVGLKSAPSPGPLLKKAALSAPPGNLDPDIMARGAIIAAKLAGRKPGVRVIEKPAPSPGPSVEDERALEELRWFDAQMEIYGTRHGKLNPEGETMRQRVRSRLSKPAPLPAEVEEAMEWLKNMEKYWAVNDHDNACIAVIKAALKRERPIEVGHTHGERVGGFDTPDDERRRAEKLRESTKGLQIPAPPVATPAEREEMLALLNFEIEDDPRFYSKEFAFGQKKREVLKAIRSLILAPPVAPVRVTRGQLEDLVEKVAAMNLDDFMKPGFSYWSFGTDDFITLLRELGILVEDGGKS